MKYIKTLEKAQEDQVCIAKGICDQKQAKCQAVAEWQDAFNALLTFSDESKDETPIYLGDKKHMAQGAASATSAFSTSGLAANSALSQPEGFGTSLSAALASRIFADTQANDIYEEFIDADDN